MKILITGGSGFIGSHIVEHFQQKADEIRVLDNLRTGYRHNLDGLDHQFIEGSVTDRALVRQAVNDVDCIFHLAAMVSVPESMKKPSECVDINDLAGGIIKAAGTSSEITHGPERAGDVRHSRASVERLQAAGWQPQFTLEQGLAETLEWFRNK